MRPPTISTTLQEVGVFPTLVYFYLWLLRGCLDCFFALFMACLWLVLWADLLLFMACSKECFRTFWVKNLDYLGACLGLIFMVC